MVGCMGLLRVVLKASRLGMFSLFLAVLAAMSPIVNAQTQASPAKESTKPAPAAPTVAEAERRKKWVCQTLLEVLGGLPNYNGPLNPRITGRIQAESYTIEKVIFESLPGFFVTANLYLPKQPGRYPAVLLQSGHTQQGKPEPQRLAANLALKGFVALAFDPVGQGERE